MGLGPDEKRMQNGCPQSVSQSLYWRNKETWDVPVQGEEHWAFCTVQIVLSPSAHLFLGTIVVLTFRQHVFYWSQRNQSGLGCWATSGRSWDVPCSSIRGRAHTQELIPSWGASQEHLGKKQSHLPPKTVAALCSRAKSCTKSSYYYFSFTLSVNLGLLSTVKF